MNTALSLGSTLRGVFTVGSRDKNTTIKRDEFFEACKCGNATIVESLFDKKYINRGVRFASANGHLEVVKYLVEMGANFRVEDEEPVRFASFYDHLEVVKYLVEKGANFRARGNWAILSASELGHLEIVKYLTEKGADFRARDDYAAKMASANGHLEVDRYLVEKGADFRGFNNSDSLVIAGLKIGTLFDEILYDFEIAIKRGHPNSIIIESFKISTHFYEIFDDF